MRVPSEAGKANQDVVALVFNDEREASVGGVVLLLLHISPFTVSTSGWSARATRVSTEASQPSLTLRPLPEGEGTLARACGSPPTAWQRVVILLTTPPTIPRARGTRCS